MRICENCGCEFYQADAERQLFECYELKLDNFEKTLCHDCAVEEWGNKGVYYDTCEICGKRFDVFKGMFSFEGFILDLCYTDYPANVIMCAGCFMVKYHDNLLRQFLGAE